jgi:signal transduction histidine kinase/ligand-binding sensor domain-containing protein
VGSARNGQAAVTFCVLAALSAPALALNPSLDVSQYAHKTWTIREGFFRSTIYSIAQTPDGYLWLGTEFGLLRFDGVQAVPWTPPGAERLPSTSVLRLLVARDGTLWIGTAAGLASWNGSKLTRYRELDEQYVVSLVEDHEGTIWAGSIGVPTGRLCAIRSGTTQCYGQDGAVGRTLLSLWNDGAGNLWAGAETGLWRWSPAPRQFYAVPHPTRDLEIRDLNRTEDGNLLLATGDGLKQFSGGRVQPYPVPGFPRIPGSTWLLRDRDGGLWIGTNDLGILHVHQGRTDVFSRSEGLSGESIASLFEDREGNVWAATNGGLDRFREFAISTVSVSQGLSSANTWSVVAARDGSVWMGTRNGLSRWKDGRITNFGKANGLPRDPAQSLFQDDAGRVWLSSNRELGYMENGVFVPATVVPGWQVHAIAGDGAGNLWLSEDWNLLRVAAGRVAEQIPWPQLGAEEDAHTLLPGGEPGGLWLGFRVGRGLIYFKDGQILQSYRTADGLGGGAVEGLKLDRDGALWAATEGGLGLVKSGSVSTITSKNGLPCDTVHWIMDDDNGSTWLYLACGLARLNRGEMDAWKADPKRAVHPILFDSSDGVMLHSREYSGYSPPVAKSADGRLWFVTGPGVQVIDPRHIPENRLPPPVHIEQITADRKVVSNRRLPARTRDLQIDYTALSLVAPEKNRFKYRLDGYDTDWVDAGNRRQAFYNNLRPKSYRFRVIASNNSGVWNETGDTLEFSIAPAWNQTSWFYGSCVAAFVAMLWGLYRLRLYQIQREFNALIDGRVDERLRVARELHDTMLQSFQAALIQMQAAHNTFTRRPEKTGESLEKAINTAAGAIAEGRSAIQDLRLRSAGGGDLAQLLTAAGQELARPEEAPGNPPAFGVTVEGARQELNPLIQDEVYRIARELLRNAFHHAQAGRIEVEIRYDSRQFRLHVRDDGKGIDPEVLKAGGRAGHYGLPGMWERANRFGGKLEFWSEAGAGTEAVLTVPGAVAYGSSHGGRFAFLRRKLWIHER